jgi:phospholipid/cholesterol/gamma-HCH transport system permease protein
MRRSGTLAPLAATPSIADIFTRGRLFEAVQAAGDMGALAVAAVRVAVAPPYTWVPAAIAESSKAFRRCVVPLALSIAVFMLALSIIVFGNLLHMLGATDREAGGMWIAFTREVCAWITSMIFAGVVGSAVTSDLGARKIREELDALAVLGVDRVRTLVVPRVAALTLAAPVLGMFAIAIAQAVNYGLAPGHLGVAPAVHRDSLISNILPLDLYASLIKYVIIGFFVGVVSCQKGLSCKGGSEGVGRAVNQTVIITFFAVWLFNSLYNLGYQTLFPETAILRG